MEGLIKSILYNACVLIYSNVEGYVRVEKLTLTLTTKGANL